MDDAVWQWNGSPWKSRSAYFGYIRGGIRRGLWNRHPCKIQFLEDHRVRIKNPNPKNAKRFPEVWGAECNVCHQIFAIKEIEVDHVNGNHSLQKFEDISKFIEAIVSVVPSDLQLICKPCHKIKNHAEKEGLSLEESRIEKDVILIMKEKRDKEWLIDRGIKPESNAPKRRKQIKEYMNAINMAREGS